MGKHKLQNGLKSAKCYFNLENLKQHQALSLRYLSSKEKNWMIIFNYTIRVLVRLLQKERPDP